MNAAHWLAFAALSAVAFGAVSYLYRRREPQGYGRVWLILLRAAALVVLLLLLFDPRMAQPADRTASQRATVLLDGSLSMLLPGSGTNSRWTSARAEAMRRAGRGSVVLFGDVPRTLTADSIDHAVLIATHSRLLPALQSAAEAGATDVAVITDGDIEDADAVARWLPRLGIRVEWVTPKESAHDLALAEIAAPPWAQAGKPLDVALGIQSNGTAANVENADSTTVTLRQDGAVIGVQKFAVPSVGRIASVHLSVHPRAPAGGGYVRIEATVDAHDGFTDDDVRNVYVYVSDEPAGIVLVSLAPDWEPRFLLPVLERAVALPARGYLRTTAANGASGQSTWLRVGDRLDAGLRVDDAAVQKAVQNADLVIIHNAGGDVPAWVNDALRTASRLIVFPASDGDALPLPVRVGAPAPDDWFVAATVPASPIAPLLGTLAVDDISPLESVMPAERRAGTWFPLLATRGRRGVPAPLAVAGEDGGRRWAIALGSGYWRWAFQGGAAADVYNRLWASLGGWLMRDARNADVAPVRPVQRAVFRGEPIRWVSRAGAMDSLHVQLANRNATSGARNTSNIVAQHDTATLDGVAPGTYSFQATAFSHGTSVSSTGDLTVETYSPEFARSRATLESGKTTIATLRARDTATRPLHASWLPYTLLVLLLAAEWILRRRWGLR